MYIVDITCVCDVIQIILDFWKRERKESALNFFVLLSLLLWIKRIDVTFRFVLSSKRIVCVSLFFRRKKKVNEKLSYKTNFNDLLFFLSFFMLFIMMISSLHLLRKKTSCFLTLFSLINKLLISLLHGWQGP